MTREEIETVLRAEMHKIAPDVEIDEIDRQEDLRDEFDIDSMDFQNLVGALSKRLGIAMPETDYGQMGSFDAMLDYLTDHVG